MGSHDGYITPTWLASDGSAFCCTVPVMLPPTLSVLLDDPVFRTYMKKPPHLPEQLSHGTPWAVWARTTGGKWRGGMFATYRDAWPVTIRAMRNPGIQDVSLVSRRRLFDPPVRIEEYKARLVTSGQIVVRTREVPILAHLFDWPYEWCPRCRRPTMFELFPRHHAIPVAIDSNVPRCWFCGLRRRL